MKGTTLNNRRMTAEEVRKLRDGALVTVLIEKGSNGKMMTIKERPGRVYYREGGY